MLFFIFSTVAAGTFVIGRTILTFPSLLNEA